LVILGQPAQPDLGDASGTEEKGAGFVDEERERVGIGSAEGS
jgi:hypothetical protein